MSGSRGGNSSYPYTPPGGSAPVVVGTATYHFLNIPITFKTLEFVGLGFVIFVLARHWGKFINDVTK